MALVLVFGLEQVDCADAFLPRDDRYWSFINPERRGSIVCSYQMPSIGVNLTENFAQWLYSTRLAFADGQVVDLNLYKLPKGIVGIADRTCYKIWIVNPSGSLLARGLHVPPPSNPISRWMPLSTNPSRRSQ
jgi:hypothetical protein